MSHFYSSQSLKSERKFIILNKKLNFKYIALILFFVSLLFSTQTYSQLASGKSKFVGNAIDYNIPSTFSKYWNQVTPGNAGKWGSVEYTQGSYNWSQLDAIYNYAISHNFPFKEHNLIWNSQQPGFMTNNSLDSAQQYQEIVNWIDTVAHRYPQTALCDVVNEPIDHAPAYKNALGGDGSTGWDWVIKAFELARQSYPSTTKLLINEYNVINSSSRNATYLQIINLLKDRGLIDGIGVQAHSFEVYNTSTGTLKNLLDKLTATGLPIYISEFSINDTSDTKQLQKYQSIFPLLYEDPGVQGITLWGYIIGDVWSQEPNCYLIDSRNAERPALVWLGSYLAGPSKPSPISPIGTTNEIRNPLLIWSSSDSATSYNVQVSQVSSFDSFALEVDSTVSDTMLQLSPLYPNATYYWRVSASNDKGVSSFSDIASFQTGTVTDVANNQKVPVTYALNQNYPNPFNPTTTISFSLHKDGNVNLVLMDVLGRFVRVMASGYYNAGNHKVILDASNLSSGVYFYRIQSGNFVDVKKLILMK